MPYSVENPRVDPCVPLFDSVCVVRDETRQLTSRNINGGKLRTDSNFDTLQTRRDAAEYILSRSRTICLYSASLRRWPGGGGKVRACASPFAAKKLDAKGFWKSVSRDLYCLLNLSLPFHFFRIKSLYSFGSRTSEEERHCRLLFLWSNETIEGNDVLVRYFFTTQLYVIPPSRVRISYVWIFLPF